MLKPSKCEPQTQNIKVQHVMNLRPHTSIYQKAQESIKLKAPKLWTWRKLKNSENLKPKFKKNKALLTAPKVESPYKKYESETSKKSSLKPKNRSRSKPKRWTLEQQNQLTMRSNLDALNGTLPKVYEQKNINLEIQTSRNLSQKKSETSNSNK